MTQRTSPKPGPDHEPAVAAFPPGGGHGPVPELHQKAFVDMTYTQSRSYSHSALPDPSTAPEFYDGVLFKRAAAWGIDVVLVAILCALLLPFTAFLGLFFFPAMMVVVGFFYRWWTIGSGSATWGMSMMAIELRERDGGRFSSATAFWHTLGYTVSILVAPLQLVSMLMMLVSARRQGLSDLILGTAAVNRPLY